MFPPSTSVSAILQRLDAVTCKNCSFQLQYLFMIWKSIALTKKALVCLNLRNGTQLVQLDRLDGLVLSKTLKLMFCTIKSRNDMKAVETMEIKSLIVSKSTYDYLLLASPSEAAAYSL